MDGGEGDSLSEHFFNNKCIRYITFKNLVDNLYLFKGPGSLAAIEKIMHYLNNNKNKNCPVLNCSLNYQTNINFANQLIPNNSFSVINTPQGYIMSINKQVVDRLFSSLNLDVSSNKDYETKKIESGFPYLPKTFREIIIQLKQIFIRIFQRIISIQSVVTFSFFLR